VPSIIDGLFSGRAGIQSHGAGISVLADNIANANTTAFKASRPDFTDLLAGTIGGGSSIGVGSGSQVSSVTQIFNQGTFEFTGRGLDLAIDGNGFFIVQDQAASGQRFYSRAGNFSVDPEGNILNQNGFNVMGFPVGGSGGLEGLNVNNRSQAGSVSTNDVTITGNIDASTPTVTLAQANAAAGSFTDLGNTAQFSTFVDVFDSLGGSHTVTTYFFHIDAATRTWAVRSYVDGADVAGVPGVPTQVGAVDNMTFNASGVKTFPSAGAVDYTAAPAWANGSGIGSIDFHFDPMTQFSSSSNIDSISQDGTGGGSVVSFNVEQDGTLVARLDNGQTSQIGTLGVAIFSNPEGLRRSGESLYAESIASGEPVVGTPGTGTFGGIESGTLELSTSDIASDFIKLISLQRGFQGSSRVITNINDLLNEIMNLA
jgi:flagellar hook protein FlgE